MAKIYGDRWQVKRSLDEGGQGIVFLVEDVTKQCAGEFVLKRLKNNARLDRFETEVSALNKVDCPSVLRVVDHSIGDPAWFVSDYCEMRSLANVKPFWRNSIADTLSFFEEIVAGVSAVHSVGIAHRDIKPANIFIKGDPLRPIIGDFGVAYIEGAERQTEIAEAVGSRLFMAPELEDGRSEVNPKRADVYSLGKLLYWLIAGEVFSREKHRDSDWDLQVKFAKSRLLSEGKFVEHINRLLDVMIVADPSKRWDADKIRVLTLLCRDLIQHRYNPLTIKGDLSCTFCGFGNYRLIANHDPASVNNAGFKCVGSSKWRVYACNNCGHVQSFRDDLANKNADTWGTWLD